MTQTLKTLAGYRANLAHALYAGTPFVPENVDLGSFSFAGWVRNGVACAITGPPQNLRAAIPVSFDVIGHPPDSTPPQPVVTQSISRTLVMYGPGDVIGIDQAQIVRRFPAPNVSLGDDSSLALIEFNRPDLPWLHSPMPAAGDRVKPWITLVVCNAANALLTSGTGGLPDKLTTLRGELQGLDDSWAWAHAQVLGASTDESSIANRMGDAHAAVNLSRLICPRRLSTHASYVACVVPTFDCGVKAGLGLGGGTLDPAWVMDNPQAEITLPVYATWRFDIGDSFDFEKLAERLLPVAAPWQIGRRAIDLRTPHGGVADDLVAPGGVQYLECALVSPFKPRGDDVLPEAEWSAARTEQLRQRVEVDKEDPNLPRVGPRLYARFQRGSTTVPGDAGNISPASDWFAAINLRPLDRIVAGLGTRVIQHDQDKLMQAAWLQVGAIRETNAAIDRIRLARYVAEALVSKTLAKLSLAPLTATTGAVHGKIGMPTTAQTVWADIAYSALPQVAAGMAFRRAVVSGPAARGAVKGAALAQRHELASMIASGNHAQQLRDLRLDYVAPVGLGAMTPAIAASIPADQLGQALGVAASIAAATAVKRFGKLPDIAAQLALPIQRWKVLAPGTSDAASLHQQQKLEVLDAAARRIRDLSPGRLEALGARYAALAHTAPAFALHADRQILSLDNLLGAFTTPVLHMLMADPTTHFATPSQPLERHTTRGSRIKARRLDSPRLGGRASERIPAAPTTPVLSGIARYANFGKLHLPDKTALTMPSNAAIAESIAALVTGTGIRVMPPTPELAAPRVDRTVLLRALDPGPVARKAILARLKTLPSWLSPTWFDDLQVNPIMAAPRFDRPMWQALADWNQDWLIPNLGLVQETDFVSLLFDNPRFTEGYLAGLSDEMGRELLWRGFPTDQRGTYFWRMWRDDVDELSGQMAAFSPGALGSHLTSSHGGNTANARVVMLLRGAVVKRHPEALFVAVQRNGAQGPFGKVPGPGEKGAILFHAPLGNDTILVGFNLTRTDIDQGNWWFLLAEHPGAPRFGLDLPEGGVLQNVLPGPSSKIPINELKWGQLPSTRGFLDAGSQGVTVTTGDGNFKWAGDSADVARILLQNPARAAFEAKAMMPPEI